MNPNEITLEVLERTPSQWEKRTVDRLVYMGGSGNMFGGGGRLAHITIHGENSIHPTGSVTVKGLATYGYNIARGENGPDSSWVDYYKDIHSFDNNSLNIPPTIKVRIDGSCGGAAEALCSILSAKQDWIKK